MTRMASYQRKMWSYHNTIGILQVERKVISVLLYLSSKKEIQKQTFLWNIRPEHNNIIRYTF